MSNNEDEQWQQVARGKSKAKVQQQISVKKMPKVKNIGKKQLFSLSEKFLAFFLTCYTTIKNVLINFFQ